MDLDDSEEEIECEEDAYAGGTHGESLDESEEDAYTRGNYRGTPDGSEEREDDNLGEEHLWEESEIFETVSRTTIAGAINLPPPPRFIPFRHEAPEHRREVRLPENFEARSPMSFFQLFFTDQVFETLAANTNAYAESKGAGLRAGGRRWRKTNAAELMIFVGLIIYMGVYKVMRLPLYWDQKGESPIHMISRYMTQSRFEQLKRYFHVAPVISMNENQSTQSTIQHDWSQKLQPLASDLQNSFQRYFIPASNISVDEMMVRFSGRSKHTVLIRSKPIPKGYKMLALCERGYTYSFMFTSRIDSFSNLNKNLYKGNHRLCPTSQAVFQLLMSLPYLTHRFILYCDNYFSNVALFAALREYGIAACGTVRPNSALYPRIFKLDKQKVCLDFNTVSGIVCLGTVLAVLWQDKILVRFLTTYHECTDENRNYQNRTRKRPSIRGNVASRQLVLTTWGNETRRLLRMPKFSIDYNNHMGGVDIADQRRSYYFTQLRVCRNWFPLFFWLLDTAIINAFIIATETTVQKKETFWRQHGLFRTRLAWNLVTAGFYRINPTYAESIQAATTLRPTSNILNCPGAVPRGNNKESRRSGYVGKNYELSPIRKAPGSHELQKGSKRLCLFCRYLSKGRVDLFNRADGPQGKIHHTNHQCSHCKEPLCRKFCMKMYHEID